MVQLRGTESSRRLASTGTKFDNVARHISRSQLQSKLRQAQAKQRRAVNESNAKVRRLKQSVDRYNRDVRAHNARVRTNRDRLRRELERLSRTPTSMSTRLTVYRSSVVTVEESFRQLEAAAEADGWTGDEWLLDRGEGEVANSVAVLNALGNSSSEGDFRDQDLDRLRATTIDDQLALLDSDLDRRWRGALFALDPRNPDAARHFCTSSRELLDQMLERAAPDSAVFAANPSAGKTERGTATRRSRVEHCLDRSGSLEATVAEFVDVDVEDVVTLFREFNDGTHGSAGRFDLTRLDVMKRRVEDAVLFVAHIVA